MPESMPRVVDITGWMIQGRDRYTELRRIHRIEKDLKREQSRDRLVETLKVLSSSELLKGIV